MTEQENNKIENNKQKNKDEYLSKDHVNLKEILNGLSKLRNNQIGAVRRTRMGAEELRRKVDMHLQILLNYYTVATIAISVMVFKYPDAKYETVNLLISIFLLFIVILTTSLNLENKAHEFKKSYTLLDNLRNELDCFKVSIKCNAHAMTFKEANEESLKIHSEYTEILSRTMNHSQFDYERYLLKNTKGKLSYLKQKKIYFLVTIYYIVLVILFSLPIGVLLSKAVFLF